MTCGVPPKHESPRSDSLAATQCHAASGHHRDPDHRHRLTEAFEALGTFPALVESRDRLLSVISNDHHATADVVSAVESDVALMTAVLRLANTGQPDRGHVETVARAVELLRPQTIKALASRVRTFDFFEHAGMWDSTPERFRLHALATQRVADWIASTAGYANRDRLAVTSLLHDIGKLVLIHAHPHHHPRVQNGATTPDEHIHQERNELGVHHAVVGGVLIRRWRLPASLATPIERHHSPDAEGEAAIIRLADMLAHYQQGARVSPNELLQSARVVGLSPKKLRRLMCELPGPNQPPRQRHIDPSPLSDRELEVLRQIAIGRMYKRIADDLVVSTSTVRSHLQHIYRKLGVVNRTQAVLIANERGWLSALACVPTSATERSIRASSGPA
jgi:HD-like signal output (HDOD) protein/DNA-binding CsgD family transcriptional regulator